VRSAATAAIAALLLAAALPSRAVADDTLVLIGGSNAAGFYEVLEHTAERAGFFKEEHIDLVNQYTSSAATAAQLVASGKADIAGLSVEAVLQGFDYGLRLVLFWARDPTYNNVLGVLADSPIRTLADFKGKDIGEINVGATPAPLSRASSWSWKAPRPTRSSASSAIRCSATSSTRSTPLRPRRSAPKAIS